MAAVWAPYVTGVCRVERGKRDGFGSRFGGGSKGPWDLSPTAASFFDDLCCWHVRGISVVTPPALRRLCSIIMCNDVGWRSDLTQCAQLALVSLIFMDPGILMFTFANTEAVCLTGCSEGHVRGSVTCDVTCDVTWAWTHVPHKLTCNILCNNEANCLSSCFALCTRVRYKVQVGWKPCAYFNTGSGPYTCKIKLLLSGNIRVWEKFASCFNWSIFFRQI